MVAHDFRKPSPVIVSEGLSPHRYHADSFSGLFCRCTEPLPGLESADTSQLCVPQAHLSVLLRQSSSPEKQWLPPLHSYRDNTKGHIDKTRKQEGRR